MSTFAIDLLFFFVGLFALITVALLGAVAFALRKMNSQLEKVTKMLEPVAVKAADTLDNVQRVTMSVGEKADEILTRGVTMTDNVSANVERTASVVNQTVTTPLIKISSLLAGVSKSISVYSGNGRSNGHAKRSEEAKE